MRHGGGEKGFSLVYRQSLVFWCLPAMVLLNSYKAIFFALLSTPQYNYLIGGIDDLPQRENQINVYDIKGSAIDDLFMVIGSQYVFSSHAYLLLFNGFFFYYPKVSTKC